MIGAPVLVLERQSGQDLASLSLIGDPMHYGVTLFPTDYSITPAELAKAAEERGFESVWFPEHTHIPLSRRSPWPGGAELPKMYYDVMDPFVALASAASVTQRIKLGTGICLIVQRDPLQLAKVVATLDQISGGRVLFGIGAGWNAEEMGDHGTDFRRRFKLMRERVEALKVIWTESKPEYHGEFVDFDPMMSWPKPVQKPHPPIHVGGEWPQGARRAIRYGNGWMPIAGRGTDVIGHLPELRKLAEEAGRNPAEIEVTLFGGNPQPAALERSRGAGISRVIFFLPPEGRDSILGRLDSLAQNMSATS
jgi:probable F420-dependent oxidoreductase